MRISQTTVAGLVAATTLAVALAGCGSKTPSKSPSGSVTSATSATSSTSGPASSAPAQPNDYAGLLIQAADIKAPETFTASPPTNNPNGQPGIATTFSTPDSNHVIHDTIQVLADAAAATNALNAAKTGQGNAIKDPQSQPMKDIGTGGNSSRATPRTATKEWPSCCSPRAGLSSRCNSTGRPACSAAGLRQRRRPKTRRGCEEGARRLTLGSRSNPAAAQSLPAVANGAIQMDDVVHRNITVPSTQ